MKRVWILSNGKALFDEVEEVTKDYKRKAAALIKDYTGWKRLRWTEHGDDVFVYNAERFEKILNLLEVMRR
ncbi:MAG: hypothetical protein QXT58_01910 [Archaeoglobaceae archaeon]